MCDSKQMLSFRWKDVFFVFNCSKTSTQRMFQNHIQSKQYTQNQVFVLSAMHSLSEQAKALSTSQYPALVNCQSSLREQH